MYARDDIQNFRELLEEQNITDTINLSPSQQRAFNIFKTGASMTIIGFAGSGKSFLIKEFRYFIQKHTPKNIAITATTGIAAYNIGGITINSFMGIGTGDQPVDKLIKKVTRKCGIRNRIKVTDILVIDEFSMLSAELFEKLNMVCQAVRRNGKFFGGIQLVLTGDPLQICPVFNKPSALYSSVDTRLIYESDLFQRQFNKKNIIELKENYRQNDPVFLELLHRIRRGAQTADDIKLLKSKLQEDDHPDTLHIVTSNKAAQVINMTHLNTLGPPTIKYNITFDQDGDPETCEELRKDLWSQFNQKGIIEIQLKVGARVMLIKNLSVPDGLVNGSVGTVTKFEKVDNHHYPVVKFDGNVSKLILPIDWELEYNNASVRATQLPLMLCWAGTVHKLQSLTIEKAVMDLADCFCDAQVYSGLSRLKSLDGLILRSFDEKKIMVNKKALEFLDNLQAM